jgi:hypothetical protein
MSGGPRSIVRLLLNFARWIFRVRGTPVLIALAAVCLFLPQPARAQAVPITYKNVNTSSTPFLFCDGDTTSLPGGVSGSTQMSVSLDTKAQTCPPVNGQAYSLSVELNATISVVVPPNLTGTPDPNQPQNYILSTPVTTKIQVTGTFSSNDASTSNQNVEEINVGPGSNSTTMTQCTTPQGTFQNLSSKGSSSLSFTYSCTQGVLAGISGGLVASTGVTVQLLDSNGRFTHEINITFDAFFYFAAGTAPRRRISA